MYAMIPFVLMLICSIFILVHNLKIKNNSKNSARNKLIEKNRQIFIILITTNVLFVLLTLPLVSLNATKNIEENTVLTTVAYMLSYSNHG